MDRHPHAQPNCKICHGVGRVRVLDRDHEINPVTECECVQAFYGKRGPLIIGLGHRRGVGKDTLTNLMCYHLREKGFDVKHVSFATKLYDICHQLFGWAGFKLQSEYNRDYASKEVILPKIGKSPRQILIEVGNHIRSVYSEVWVHSVLHEKCDIVISSDLRYPNEYTAIKAANGVAIKVVRPGVPEYDDIADSALKDHHNWDYTIINDGSIGALDTQARELCDEIIKRAFVSVFRKIES